MRKLLGTLVIVFLVLAIIGNSRGWFTVNRQDEGTQTELQVRINRERIREDTRQAAEMARGLGDNLERKFEPRDDSPGSGSGQ